MPRYYSYKKKKKQPYKKKPKKFSRGISHKLFERLTRTGLDLLTKDTKFNKRLGKLPRALSNMIFKNISPYTPNVIIPHMNKYKQSITDKINREQDVQFGKIDHLVYRTNKVLHGMTKSILDGADRLSDWDILPPEVKLVSEGAKIVHDALGLDQKIANLDYAFNNEGVKQSMNQYQHNQLPALNQLIDTVANTINGFIPESLQNHVNFLSDTFSQKKELKR